MLTFAFDALNYYVSSWNVGCQKTKEMEGASRLYHHGFFCLIQVVGLEQNADDIGFSVAMASIGNFINLSFPKITRYSLVSFFSHL